MRILSDPVVTRDVLPRAYMDTMDRVSLVATAGQSIATATWTAISWDTTPQYNVSATPTLPFVAGTPTRVTARMAGIYSANGTIHFASLTQGDKVLAIRKNGNEIAAQRNSATPAGGGSAGLLIIYEFALVVGDYIELFGYQNTGSAAALSTSGSYNRLTVRQVA